MCIYPSLLPGCFYSEPHIPAIARQLLAFVLPVVAQDDMMGTWGGKEGVQGPVQAVKDSLMAAEKSAYEMYKHFSDGLKEDVQEVS